MKLKNINEISEFTAVNDPLRSLEKELRENKGRLEEIHIELSQKSESTSGAWDTYLSSEDPHAHARHEELSQEARRIESRQQFLRQALDQGHMEVEKVRSRLSLAPCAEAKPGEIADIRNVFRALKEIERVVARMRERRDEIQKAGYKIRSLPSAEFKADGFDVYRKYIVANYPELIDEL